MRYTYFRSCDAVYCLYYPRPGPGASEASCALCSHGLQRLRDVPRTLRQRYIDADQISGQGREIGPPCESVLTEKTGRENVGHAISSLQSPLLLSI